MDLVNFTVRKAGLGVELQWKVANQTNSSHFDVERSYNSETFHFLGKVNAAVNSSETVTYHFLDPSTSRNIVYYRLKLVDQDGQFKYSGIVSLKGENVKDQLVKIYPTILSAAQQITIEINSDSYKTAALQLFDTHGKQLQSQSLSLVPGVNRFNLVLNRMLSPGLIYISVKGDDLYQTIPVFNQQK